MRSTWRIETMVLHELSPELSRPVAYTTRKTVNRVARRKLHLILERNKTIHRAIDVRKYKNVRRQTYSFLEVMLRRLRKKITMTNMISVIRNNIYSYCTCKHFWINCRVRRNKNATSSFQLLKLEIYCDDHSPLSTTSAVQIWICFTSCHSSREIWTQHN